MNRTRFSNSAAGLLLFMAAYSAALLFLLPKLSLWIDEILTLIGAMKPDVPSLFGYLKTIPGGTPLAFLVPGWFIKTFGYSTLSARLSAAVFSLAACPALFLLARRSGLRWPLLAVAVFSLCPLQFRYAMEARPYSAVLCFSAWSTVALLWMRDDPKSWMRVVAYTGLSLVATFTIAFTLFVPVSHFVWSVAEREKRLASVCAGSLTICGIALAPWYLYARQGWSQMVAVERIGSMGMWQVLSLILHELTGAGYAGTIVILLVAVWGAARFAFPQHTRTLWILGATVPAALVLLGDVMFHYFLAVRQMIFVLIPLALLFTAGVEAAGWAGKLLAIAFLGIALYADANWISRPREDWQAATATVVERVQQGACVLFLPEDAKLYYGFFEPKLLKKRCDDALPYTSAVLARSPFDPDKTYEFAQKQLASRGLEKQAIAEFHGPTVEFFSKPGY